MSKAALKNVSTTRVSPSPTTPKKPPRQFHNIKKKFSYNFTETRKKMYRNLLYLAVDQAKYTPPTTLAALII